MKNTKNNRPDLSLLLISFFILSILGGCTNVNEKTENSSFYCEGIIVGQYKSNKAMCCPEFGDPGIYFVKLSHIVIKRSDNGQLDSIKFSGVYTTTGFIGNEITTGTFVRVIKDWNNEFYLTTSADIEKVIGVHVKKNKNAKLFENLAMASGAIVIALAIIIELIKSLIINLLKKQK